MQHGRRVSLLGATGSVFSRLTVSLPAVAMLATVAVSPAGLVPSTFQLASSGRVASSVVARRLPSTPGQVLVGETTPKITIISDGLVVQNGRVLPTLACTRATCAGSLLLIDRQRGKPHYELGASSHRLAANTTEVVVLRLDHQGLLTVAMARPGMLPVLLVATLAETGKGTQRLENVAT